MKLQAHSKSAHELPRGGVVPQLAALGLSVAMTLTMLASVETLATSAPPPALWALVQAQALARA
ncbi:MAG: hypothetical protein KGL18_02225 [Burkholderiales bacterium]|nr:hypothetical protein [Burkholderiales bacterium]MDE1928265.1 hypothetical protein [Burkholderiales bacterium]MDE2501785.1 hypothetical protein [Burkholderiales bacterium]